MTQTNELYVVTRKSEASLLGAILIESTRGTRLAIDYARLIVEPSDFTDSRFYDSLHTRIFQAMLSCKEPPNQVVVAEEMYNQGKLQKLDCSYLCTIVAECPDSLDYHIFANRVADHALSRKVNYHASKCDFNKVQTLIQKRKKPKFSGGILYHDR